MVKLSLLIALVAFTSVLVAFIASSQELFATPQSCAECHQSFLIDWNQTMHSKAALDPYFKAKFYSEAEIGKIESLLEKECSKCHTPLTRLQALRDSKIVRLYDEANLELSLSGVSCTLCHQIKKNGVSGGYIVDLKAEKPNRVIYGPFIPVHSIVMQNAVSYYPAKNENLRRGEFCGNCHTVYTPIVKNGEVVGRFPEQTTFFEWQNSKYIDKPCQNCHMREERMKITTKPENVLLRDAKRHIFSGANALILGLFNESGAERSLEMLKSAAKVKITSSDWNGSNLEIVVRVDNEAGHKFPTGFPSRKAFLHVIVRDSRNVVFESGKYEGNFIYGENYPEPHYETIDSEDEVQIYESVMMDENGNPTTDLIKAVGYLKDNRILPKGFNLTKAHPDTLPVEAELHPGFDEVRYIVKNVSKPVSVRVELLYQPISYQFLQALAGKEADEFRKTIAGLELTYLVAFDEVELS